MYVLNNYIGLLILCLCGEHKVHDQGEKTTFRSQFSLSTTKAQGSSSGYQTCQ